MIWQTLIDVAIALATFGAFVIASVTANFSGVLLDLDFFYPLFMSYVWIAGGAYYYFHWERHEPGPEVPPDIPSPAPLVSILVPCHNEGGNVDETIGGLITQNYPNFEIIAINDGSSDNTGTALDALLPRFPNLRVIHFASNQGKAMGLCMGALVARGEYLVCIDGDAVLHPNATAHLVKHFIHGPRVGAVTGNPRVRTRSTLLGRVQVGEFSSIVGLIKRSQRIYGNIFTVSGVVVAFRRSALHMAGYWNLNMVTEDIDVSWALELKHWAIRYEPSALCWIMMPETFRGLWSQRMRWSQGGAEVLLKYFNRIWVWRHRRMWLVILEYIISVLWAYSLMLSVVLWALGKIYAMSEGLNVPSIFPPAFWGLVLAGSYMLQSAVASVIESRYERGFWRSLFWVIWYPTAFWALSCVTSLFAFPKALFKRRGIRAVWKSPDRGYRSYAKG